LWVKKRVLNFFSRIKTLFNVAGIFVISLDKP
jgi:hypothetical protein